MSLSTDPSPIPLATLVHEPPTAQHSPSAHPAAAKPSSVAQAAAHPNPAAGIEYQKFLDCVHCGLCTAHCPTYVESGNENDSPRGRIYLMRSVADGRLELGPQVRRHLELCLDCRACETACPSGVQYGRLIEPFRVAMEQLSDSPHKSEDWFHRYILFGVFPYPRRMRRLLWPARAAQRLGLMRLAETLRLPRLLPERLQRLLRMLPPPQRRQRPLPAILPAEGKCRARVGLFTGCIGDVMFRHTHWATARVLQKNGCDVFIPPEQVCCGAIHFHSGASDPARAMADANLAAFGSAAGGYAGLDAILVNVAGCGAMLKDYGHHWPDERQHEREAFSRKVQDVHEFLDQLELVPPPGRVEMTATYHDACHLLHAQRIREAPRRLLAQVPGLVLKDLPETEICCGAAGTYNLTEPEMSDRLSQRKLANILRTGADTVLTANAGCLLQIAAEARRQRQKLWIAHPMDVLDRSYREV